MHLSQTSKSTLNFTFPRYVEGVDAYIIYYVIYPPTGQLRRKRIKLNRIKSKSQRLKMARFLINDLTNKLMNGWNPFILAENPKGYKQLSDVLDEYLAIKKLETEEQTIKSYQYYIRKLKKYIEKIQLNNSFYVFQFNESVASTFALSLKQGSNLSGCSYNNHLTYYVGLFNWLIEYKYIKVNPFLDIKRIPKKKLKEKRRRMLTSEQMQTLYNYLNQTNKFFLLMCLFCYYCFMRGKEIALIKISDINLKNQTIRVSGDVAKNDHKSYRTIPDIMVSLIKELKLEQYDENMYLFGYHSREATCFLPEWKAVTNRKIEHFWNKFVRKNCNFDLSITFYSQKDTGMTNMSSKGIPINFIKQQADHSSIEITSKYIGDVVQAHEEIKKINEL